MNARQKAKKYKKELEQLKAIKPLIFRNKVAYSYDKLNAISNIPMADRENMIKDDLIKPLVNELKNIMSVKLVEDDESRRAIYSTDIYIATERGRVDG